MAISEQTYKKISAFVIANVIFCFLALMSTENILAQDQKAIESERTLITKLILNGKTDEALKEYENLVMITGKEDLALLRDIMSAILNRKNPLTIAVLGNLKEKNVVPFVVEALKGRDNSVAKSAAEALRNLNDEKAIPPLIEVALCHSDQMVREETLETLKYFHSSGLLYKSHVPVILQSLQNCIDIDESPLSFAVKILGELGDARATPVLLELFERVNNPSFRDYSEQVPKEIAKSLNKLGDNSASAALIKLLGKGNEKQSINAALASGALGDKRVVPALIRNLKDKKASDYVRVNAAKALSSLGNKEAIPALFEALKDDSGWVREQSAVALYGLGEKHIFPIIIQEMTANRHGIDSVIEGLKRNGNLVPLLMQVLSQQGLSPVNYIRAASLLGEAGDRRAVPVLIQTLKDIEPGRRQARENAAIALGDLGDKRAVSALIDSVGIRDDMDLSKAALEALYKLGDKRAVPALIRDLEDEEGFYLRGDEIMTFNSGQNLVTEVDKDMHRGAIATALGKLGDASAVPILVKCLFNKRYYRARLKTAEALGELRDKRAVPALIKVVEEKDKWLNQAAAMALAKLDDKRAIPLLIESFAINEDDYGRMQVVQSICEFGQTAIPTLINALGGKDPLIRTWAAQTIGEIYSKTTALLYDDLVKNMSFGAGKGPQRKTKSEVLKDKSAGELNAILSSNNSALSIQTPGLLMNMDDNSVLPKEQADLRDKLRIKGPNAVIKMKDEIAISNLKERLKNEDPLVKSRAGDLKKLSDDSGSPVLKETLNDLNPKVKDYSAALLGNEAGLHAALKVLRERLNDSSYNVQVASAEALWRIVKNAEY